MTRLSILFLLAFCALWSAADRRRLELAGTALALLAMTSLYGLIVAAGLAAGVVWETWTHQPDVARSRRALGFAANFASVRFRRWASASAPAVDAAAGEVAVMRCAASG